MPAASEAATPARPRPQSPCRSLPGGSPTVHRPRLRLLHVLHECSKCAVRESVGRAQECTRGTEIRHTHAPALRLPQWPGPTAACLGPTAPIALRSLARYHPEACCVRAAAGACMAAPQVRRHTRHRGELSYASTVLTALHLSSGRAVRAAGAAVAHSANGAGHGAPSAGDGRAAPRQPLE